MAALGSVCSPPRLAQSTEAVTSWAGGWYAMPRTLFPRASGDACRPVSKMAGSSAGYRLRAFQTSSHGHRRAHSAVTMGYRVVASSGGRTSIRSSTSKPLARSSRTQSP